MLRVERACREGLLMPTSCCKSWQCSRSSIYMARVYVAALGVGLGMLACKLPLVEVAVA